MEKGKYYEVPCIRANWRFKVGWYPIVAEMHNDPEIDFPWDHWHIDYRFIRQADLDRFANNKEEEVRCIFGLPIMLRLVVPEPMEHEFSLSTESHQDNDNTFLRKQIKNFPRHSWYKHFRLLYKREWPLFAPHWMLRCKLQDSMRDKKLDLSKNPLICPHRGYDLTGTPSVNGVITCPLHGLQWCDETGEGIYAEVHSPDGWGSRSYLEI